MQASSKNKATFSYNHCTIAHITVLLVALTAAKNDLKNKSDLLSPFYLIIILEFCEALYFKF